MEKYDLGKTNLLGRAGEQSLDVLDGLRRWLFIWTRWLCCWREISLSRGSQPMFSQHFSCVCYSDRNTTGAWLLPKGHPWPRRPSTRPSLDTDPTLMANPWPCDTAWEEEGKNMGQTLFGLSGRESYQAPKTYQYFCFSGGAECRIEGFFA